MASERVTLRADDEQLIKSILLWLDDVKDESRCRALVVTPTYRHGEIIFDALTYELSDRIYYHARGRMRVDRGAELRLISGSDRNAGRGVRVDRIFYHWDVPYQTCLALDPCLRA